MRYARGRIVFILMGGVFGLCTTHTLVYINNATGDDGPEHVESGSFPCPKCGEIVDVLSGTYERRDDVHGMTRLIPTDETQARVSDVLGWAREAAESGTVAPEVIAETLEETVAQQSPTAARALAAFRSQTSMSLAAWIGVLLMLLTYLATSNDGLTEEDVEQVMKDVLQQQSPSEQDPPTEPSPPTRSPGQPPTVTELPTPDTR